MKKDSDEVLRGLGFAAAAPLEIDFGCHRGAFLLGMAALHPGVNFLGIEKQIDRVEKCNARAERFGLPNARAIQGIGAESLKELPAGCISVFHLYFRILGPSVVMPPAAFFKNLSSRKSGVFLEKMEASA